MKITINRTIGGTTYAFEIDKEKGIDALSEAGTFAAMPAACGLCGSIHVHLSSSRAKGYVFVKVLCQECNGRAQLGQYKDGGFFWKGWDKYAPLSAEEPPQE